MVSAQLPMVRMILFAAGSAVLIRISWRFLHGPGPCTHGFWRFFAFESILALILWNAPYWFQDPLAPAQVASWILLTLSIPLAGAGVSDAEEADLRRTRSPAHRPLPPESETTGGSMSP